MYAQRKTATAPRSRQYGNRPAPARLRFGLIMRKGMDFGELGDIETALRFEGVSLAPISTGEGSLVSGGLTVLATATADDISGGRVQGVVIPGGMADEAGLAQVKALVNLAKTQGLPPPPPAPAGTDHWAARKAPAPSGCRPATRSTPG
ncbi:hypothetical protein, partial [Brevundimonas sp. NPDC055320]